MDDGTPLLDMEQVPIRMDPRQLLPPQAAQRRRRRKRANGQEASQLATAIGHVDGTSTKLRRKRSKQTRPNLVPHHHASLRRHVYAVVSGKSRSSVASIAYKYLLVALITLNLGLFIASTEGKTDRQFEIEFQWIEGITCVLYLIDYGLKIWSIVEAKHHHDPLWGRIHYIFSFYGFVDAISTFPFFIELFAAAGGSNFSIPSTAWLRILGLFRILKTERFIGAFHSVARVIYSNRDVLIVGLVVCTVLLLITSTLLYFVHRGTDNESSANFSSITATMYLSALMLTGQGIPEGNLSLPLKLVVVLTAMFSVAVFTVPSAMLAWGFEAEAERLQEDRRRRIVRRIKAEREGLLFIESSSSSDYDILSGSDEDSSEGDNWSGGELQQPQSVIASSPKSLTMDCPHCGHSLDIELRAS